MKEYFNKVVPYQDNMFAALNTAVWSGGSFIYIPKGVKIEKPLQSYFRINSEQMGQFERTLIIVDEGSELHYMEGCTAPTYSTDSLHAAVVEIFVGKNAKCRYTTIQNWSNNVYNLVTKRALCKKEATMEWIDVVGIHCHIGSQIFEMDAYTKAMKNFVQFAVDIKNTYVPESVRAFIYGDKDLMKKSLSYINLSDFKY